jgi:hypothetical protein
MIGSKQQAIGPLTFQQQQVQQPEGPHLATWANFLSNNKDESEDFYQGQ